MTARKGGKRCSQCGQSFSARACGPTHALIRHSHIGKGGKRRAATAKAETQRITAKVLREINKRLRVMGRNAEINYVAFRLSIQPSKAARLLNGLEPLRISDLSRLALAVGCEFKVKVLPASRLRGGRG